MKVIRTTFFLLSIIFHMLACGEAMASPTGLRPIQHIDRSDPEVGQKPVIDSISEPKYQLEGYNFTLDFTVYFHGTDRIDVMLEEEFAYNILVLRVEGTPVEDDSVEDAFFAHVKTEKMSALYYSWVTIEASNEYGRTNHTIEIPPYFTEDIVKEVTEQRPTIEVIDSTVLIKCNSEVNVTVASLDGRTVYDNRISQDTEIPLEPGMFILTCSNQTTSCSKKIMIR